jgi:hypothetical protein
VRRQNVRNHESVDTQQDQPDASQAYNPPIFELIENHGNLGQTVPAHVAGVIVVLIQFIGGSSSNL